MSLKEFYEQIIKDPSNIFVIHSMDDIRDFDMSSPDILVPGSFNPLHFMHIDLFRSALLYHRRSQHMVAFELSVSRFDKEDLSFEDLEERLKQFFTEDGLPIHGKIVITNAALFTDKIKHFQSKSSHMYPSFFIGADVADKLIQHMGLKGLATLNARFYVSQRLMEDGSIEDLNSLSFKYGYICCMMPNKYTGLSDISSTKLRNKQ